MKKLKLVKTFESFKVNEEVPYNYEAGEELVGISWSPEEKSDLEKLGADNIDKNTASFIERGGDLNVTITKSPRGFGGEVQYVAKSDQPNREGYFTTCSSSNWNAFLRSFDGFMRNGGYNRNRMSAIER